MHAHIAAISYCFARGHILFVDEFDGVHTLNVSRALGKAAKFVGKAVMPDCMVFFHFDELAVFKSVSSLCVYDCSGEVLLDRIVLLGDFKHVCGYAILVAE